MKLPCATFREYLELRGLLNAPDDVIARAQMDWKRLYAKAYWSEYEKAQVSIVLPKAEHIRLLNKAQSAGLKITEYLHQLILSDQKDTRVQPKLLIDLEVRLLKTMDQLAKKMGASDHQRSVLLDTYRELEQLLILLL